MENRNADALIAYYGKFNEEKRLDTRHGRVEFEVTMHYIRSLIARMQQETGREKLSLADIGAGTGRYTLALAAEYPGMDITAVELVNHNLGRLRQKAREAGFSRIKPMQGDAMDLHRLPEEGFDITLLFGPLYHLKTDAEKEEALREAKRITRKGGILLVAYVMNEYALLIHGFREHHIVEDGVRNTSVDEAYHIIASDEDLYSFIRIEDADRLNASAGLTRLFCFSPDGPANHMRQELNRLDEEEFAEFVRYQISVSRRQDLIGAGAHIVDVLMR